MDNVAGALGIARKAGKLELGEEPAGSAARARKAALMLVAQDAAANSVRRAQHFADVGRCPCTQLPFSREELGRLMGRSSLAMMAVTDASIAESLLKKLSAADGPEKYAEALERVSERAEAQRKRRKEERKRR